MTERFDFEKTPISDLYLVRRNPLADSRGFFSRFFCAEEFKSLGLMTPIAQINHTLTRAQGTIRGLHFQHPPHAETKIVTCLQGVAWDVAIDIRKNSPTYLHWHGVYLRAEEQQSYYIPEGFAHGFQTLTDDCELLYLHSAAYAPDAEGALNALDPDLAISWPVKSAEMSERDSSHPFVRSAFEGIIV